MKMIVIGSTNPVKIQAVEEVLTEWKVDFDSIQGVNTLSGVRNQPLSLEETIKGAKNRAQAVYQESGHLKTVGIGIESGLMQAPGTSTGYIEATICCFYDGLHLATGLSCGFEVPPNILDAVLNRGLDLGQACHDQNIGGEPGLGKREGLVGIVTCGHIPRKNYTKQAVMMALGQWLHPQWYRQPSDQS
jgi:inosine/xanthosine triphosphatase